MKRRNILFLLSMVLPVVLFGFNNLMVFAQVDVSESKSDYQVYSLVSNTIDYCSFSDLPLLEEGGSSPGYFPNGVGGSVETEVSVCGIVDSDN